MVLSKSSYVCGCICLFAGNAMFSMNHILIWFYFIISFWRTDDGGNDGGDADDESDTEDLAEADEDESDLDLAWKMLDVARAIVEKHPDDTMEKVDILSALAEVALERGLLICLNWDFYYYSYIRTQWRLLFSFWQASYLVEVCIVFLLVQRILNLPPVITWKRYPFWNVWLNQIVDILLHCILLSLKSKILFLSGVLSIAYDCNDWLPGLSVI